MSNSNSTPVNFFQQALKHQCTIKLNDGTKYTGILSLIDGLMNVVMENAEEYCSNKKTGDHKECFLRGNNVCYISIN
ncbi:Small nuclear ribonucleoprotein f [Entamoeba marina]